VTVVAITDSHNGARNTAEADDLVTDDDWCDEGDPELLGSFPIPRHVACEGGRHRRHDEDGDDREPEHAGRDRREDQDRDDGDLEHASGWTRCHAGGMTSPLGRLCHSLHPLSLWAIEAKAVSARGDFLIAPEVEQTFS
jgi:hypothetical protein